MLRKHRHRQWPCSSVVASTIHGQFLLVLLLAEVAPDFDFHALDRPAFFVGHRAAERLLARQ